MIRLPRFASRRLAVLVALVSSVSLESAATARDGVADYGKVELIRDRWGTPHVFAATDAGAFYGLGQATAEDRGFQMHYALRVIQGRLAEVVGDVQKTRRRDTSIDSDRKMRTFGFHRVAKKRARELDAESRALLDAYCRGVNDWFRDHRDDRPELFARLGLEIEPWTPADCIASWWHIAQFFGTDGTRDLLAWRRATGDGPRPPGNTRPPDATDATAVVQESDVDASWVREVRAFAVKHGIIEATPKTPGEPGPKFSHAWVVGRDRTTTGSAVLVSDPQTIVGNPSLFYEFHIRGKTFDARGIGVAGSPIVLIGWNRRVAWGMTALGADQADLFRLETDRAHPGKYRSDGEWRDMRTLREEIRVKGGRPRRLDVRLTHLGPVVTEFCFARPGDPQVALRRVPLCDTGRHTFSASLAMLRSRNVREFLAALDGWRFPSANVVFGDAAGDIGYSVVGAMPVRSALALQAGRDAHDGSAAKFGWQRFVPQRLLPHVMNPAAGAILSANHRPVASFYPIPIGIVTGAGGDTIRSWRLRELLAAKKKFTPRDVLDVHFDSVNPVRREVVRLGFHLLDTLKRNLSLDAIAALAHLEKWYESGASVDLNQPGAALALEMDTSFRFVNTPLTERHGGGLSGLASFLTDTAARIVKDPKAPLDTIEEEFVDNALAQAWRRANQLWGPDVERWDERARARVRQRKLGYYASLDGFGSLDPSRDVQVPGLGCVDGNTIRSQGAQAYTQWVPLHDIDTAQSLLPIGASERIDDPSRLSSYADWEKGVLHPAPLSRTAVEKIARSRRVVSSP